MSDLQLALVISISVTTGGLVGYAIAAHDMFRARISAYESGFKAGVFHEKHNQ